MIVHKLLLVVVLSSFHLSCDAVSPETIKVMLYGQRRALANIQTHNVSSDCMEGIRKMTINNTIKALDSFGKPGAGILAGNVNWLGHFDECTSLYGFQYCSIIFNVSQLQSVGSIPFTYGLCAPKECSDVDIYNGIDFFIDKIPGLDGIISLEASSLPTCTKNPHRAYDAKFIVTVIFFSLLFLLVIASSLYHAWYHSPACRSMKDSTLIDDQTSYPPKEDQAPLVSHEDPSKSPVQSTSIRGEVGPARIGTFHSVIFSFALPNNLPKLLSGKMSRDSIPCLNGIRVLSILWVILGHVFSFPMLIEIFNPLTGLGWFQRFGFLLVSNAFFSVDSFFFLSGLLVTYLTLKQLKKSDGHIPWRWFYFHRYWRLTPAMAVTMLFYVFITPYFGHGPFAQTLSAREDCPKYWWTNLLYINNFYPIHDAQICIGWVWYLANDMQFFIISPLIILPLYYIPWLGMSLIAVLCAGSMCATAALMAVYNFPAAIMDITTATQSDDTFTDVIYNKPYCRITPYLVGMLLGYVIYKYPRKSIKLHWVIALLGWIVATGIAFACIFSLYNYYNIGPWSKAANVIYQMFCRFAWGVFLAWVVFACHYGYGGWVNSLLGHPAWAPLGRLTYTAYLIHPIILSLFLQHQGSPFYLSLTLIAFYFAGVSLLTYACAAIFSLTVEFPLVGLEKLFIPRN
ncbi:nose resistant to fluoxetine protein 6-like isoform X2 [Apostichopus japonicus]|uniref:nose resistant to fluoxetine protein 6-like isoform X2 n=1 Tax=Stichopus japonicus TaxID=307972 RepID=UPI003AB8EBC1